MAWLTLPYEIIRAILSWLPVNSLLRFKWVSNQCFRLISNPDSRFLKSHFKRSKPGILVVSKTLEETNTLFDYAQHYTSPDDNLTRFQLPSSHSIPNNYRVVNICNGLVCFTDFYPEHYTKVYVWNPFTGDHVTIPSSPLPSYLIPEDYPGYDRFRQVDVLYGFGFHPPTTTTATDVYKVIKFVSASPLAIGGDCDSHVTVYTLGQDSLWTTLPKIPYRITPDNPSTALLNGFLYWFAPMLNLSVGWYTPKKFLIAFNIQNDTFQEIPLPHGINYDLTKTVGVLDGLLCIFCSHEAWDDLEVEIWVMAEYGVADSWRLHSKIEEPEVCGRFLRLLGDADSREIILWTFDQELISYDPKTNLFRKLHMFGGDVLETHVFRGSLLSPTIINGANRPAT